MGDAAVHQFNNIKLGAKGTKVGLRWVCPWLAFVSSPGQITDGTVFAELRHFLDIGQWYPMEEGCSA